MVVVAVAGGTGAVGRNIVEAFVSQGKHEVIILSRTVCHTWLSIPLPS
jgi:nucleoside-diphosphate-sugar epimerase